MAFTTGYIHTSMRLIPVAAGLKSIFIFAFNTLNLFIDFVQKQLKIVDS